jgi:Fe-S-cluster-containing dehydrogenase component
MSISRRGFLKGAAIGSVATATLSTSAKGGGGVEYFEGYPGRMGLLHDATLCVGCRSCEAACNQVNDLPPPERALHDKSVFDETRGITDHSYTVVNRYQAAKGNQPAVFRKHQCMHCSEPCCASVCFVKAFVKTPEGPVLYDPEVCVGCRYCVFACPYYALAYEYDDPLTPRVVRCTMCYPLIKQGKNPACADACPTGAIQYGKRKDLMTVARERMRKYPERYIDHIFGEHEFGGTSWLTLVGVPLRTVDLPEHVTHDPLPNLTTSFLSLAPLVAAIFPGLLAGVYAFSKRKDDLEHQAHTDQERRLREEARRELEEKLKDTEARATREREEAMRWESRPEPPPPAPKKEAPKEGSDAK